MKRANGMGTIIKLSGNRRKPWAIRRVIGWKQNGNPIIKYQGYYRTKREAEAALNEYNANPYTISNKTLDEIYTDWYAQREKDKADNTLRQYRALYAHCGLLKDMKVKDIDRTVLQRFYNDVDATANSLTRIKRLLNLLFEYAVGHNYMPVSALNLNSTIVLPAKAEVRRPRSPRTIISNDEINMLWGLVDTNEYAKIILTYIYTGLRFSELRDLTPDCCHDNYIEIRRAKTKAGVRIVPLCDKILKILPIIPVPPHTTFNRHFKHLLPNHCIHETRHTFVSLMTQSGCEQHVLKAIVGHSTTDVTDIYTHVPLDVMLEAVNRL